MPLTDAKIRNAKATDKPLKLTDGGGLYLEVRPTGAKLWRLRYRIGGKENVFAIGGYPEVGLADARSEREKVKPLIRQGIHPSHNRQAERLANSAANANTFEAVTREWIKKKAPSWTPFYLRQVERTMESEVFPFVGKLPIRNVSAAHLLEILSRIEARGAATVALLVRQCHQQSSDTLLQRCVQMSTRLRL